MAFTYDITTLIGQVRAIIPDANPAAYTFEDDEIQVFLNLWSQDLLLATSQGKRTLAALYARNAISYSIAGFSVDRKAVAAQLLQEASTLEASARGAPFELETTLDYFQDLAGNDRSNYPS